MGLPSKMGFVTIGHLTLWPPIDNINIIIAAMIVKIDDSFTC